MILVLLIGILISISIVVGIIMFLIDVFRYRGEHDFAEKRKKMINEILSYMENNDNNKMGGDENG